MQQNEEKQLIRRLKNLGNEPEKSIGEALAGIIEKLRWRGFCEYNRRFAYSDKQGFLNWIKAGHAFIGIHAASDTFHGWPGYIDMLGGEFQHHAHSRRGLSESRPEKSCYCVIAESLDNPAGEIYQFKNYDPAKVHDLLILDKHPETGATRSLCSFVE